MTKILAFLLVALVGLSAFSSIVYLTQDMILMKVRKFRRDGTTSNDPKSKFEVKMSLLEEELDVLDSRRKTVIISGHGRSGSTLTGSIFQAPNWVFHFEPLKLYDWPQFFTDRFDAGNSSQCSRNDFTVRHKMRCPVADMMYLLDLLHCRNTDRPLQALDLEVEGVSNHEVMRQIDVSKPLHGSRDALCKSQIYGVAVKTIRINGFIDDLFRLSDLLDLKLDLVVHLLRDPRAVLASRLTVGWGKPTERTYDATLEWATEMCGQTMADNRAGQGRDDYLLLRYEDLAAESVINTERLYKKLGQAVPFAVQERMKKNELATMQKTSLNAGKHEALEKVNNVYGVRPRDFIAQLIKWKSELNSEEIQAVSDGCSEVLKTHYSDFDVLLKNKTESSSSKKEAVSPVSIKSKGKKTALKRKQQ